MRAHNVTSIVPKWSCSHCLHKCRPKQSSRRPVVTGSLPVAGHRDFSTSGARELFAQKCRLVAKRAICGRFEGAAGLCCAEIGCKWTGCDRYTARIWPFIWALLLALLLADVTSQAARAGGGGGKRMGAGQNPDGLSIPLTRDA